MEQPPLPGIDERPDAIEKSVLADVVWLTHPCLCLGLMPLPGLIIGRVGIQYPGS